jgi:predicted lipid-binding transport protein (Tim44 family)
MGKYLTILITLLGFTAFALDADARRLGGARNIGKQREAISQQQAAPKPPAAPAQQQAAPNAANPAQPQGSKWLGPLAGLALGAGLAALFLNNGIAGLLAGVLLIGLIAAAALYVARLLREKPAAEPIPYAGAAAAGGREPTLGAAPVPGGAGLHSVAAMSRWPAGFDADEFVRHARRNFVRLQAAHDRGDLETIRDFVTPELYRELEAETRAAAAGTQHTEVVTLNAEVLDVTTEGDCHVVSVRFSGLIRESAGEEPQPFSEIWHLEKPLGGGSGWLVAGIQQA